MRLAVIADVQARRDHCRNCPKATKHPDRLERPSKGLWAKSVCTACPDQPRIKSITQNADFECPLKLFTKVAGVDLGDPSVQAAMKAAFKAAIEAARAKWGPALWDRFHSGLVIVALTQKAIDDFVKSIIAVIPGCGECKRKFKADVAANPPRFASRIDLITWGLERHNTVRLMQGKAPYMLSDTLARYGDGGIDQQASKPA